MAKNMKELEKQLQKFIKGAMQNEVAHVARNTLKENVVTEVYDEYTPYSTDGVTEHYERTGGLLQDENIETNMIDGSTLSVRSTREDGGRDIAEVIEYGKGYSWGYRRNLDEEIGARPFHEKTAKELKEKGLAKKALVDGLRKQGIKTE